MKIAICVCFSEKNISHHKKILRDINQIIIPKGYHLKFYAVLNQNVLYLNNLINLRYYEKCPPLGPYMFSAIFDAK